jgi:hypothetical protein
MQRSGFLAKAPKPFKWLSAAMIVVGSCLLVVLVASATVAAFTLYPDLALWLTVAAGWAFGLSAVFSILNENQRKEIAATRLRELSTMQRGVGGYYRDQMRDAGRGHLVD